MSVIWIHFCRLIACQMSDKIFYSFLKIVCSMPVWKNKPFLKNCLTRIQTFHRLFEANCLYNRMEKNSYFAEQLFDKKRRIFPCFVEIFLYLLYLKRIMRLLTHFKVLTIIPTEINKLKLKKLL
jgi:hypothetical protein